MRARVRPNAMHVITGLLAADREGERGKIFNPMTAARARGTRTFDRRPLSIGRGQRISSGI